MLKRAILIMLATAVSATAQVVIYRADSFPEEDRWTRDPTIYRVDRRIDEGQLVQAAKIFANDPGDPSISQRDSYRLSLADFAGAATFFTEWRMYTNNPPVYGAVAPAVFVTANQLGVLYHFVIGDDQLRLLRDVSIPHVYFDIKPGVAHTYRLELYGTDEFRFFIDGELEHTGVPEGPFPTSDAVIATLCGATLLDGDTLCWWDEIRFGLIPLPGSGDYHSDGEVGRNDLFFFMECLSNQEAGSWPGCAWADMDSDGDTDCDDWALFLEAWTDPVDPPGIPECGCAPADLDCNGSVNAFDLALLLGSWGPCPDPDDCPADLDGDGFVNAFDLAILLGSWG